MAPGGTEHSVSSLNAGFYLKAHCKRVKTGRVYGNEAGVVTEPVLGTVRGADALYISYKRLPKGKTFGSKGFLRAVPELVVEVMGRDDSWKDMETKVAEYHKLGVDLVWVLVPNTFSVRVHPRGGEPYVLSKKDTITGGKVLPKFKCKVERFFED